MPTKGEIAGKKIQVSVDRNALRDVLASLSKPTGESEWCVACGAGAASAKLDYPSDVVNKAGAQLIEPGALRELVESIKDFSEEQAWCVACGAGAAASPLTQVINPEDISDELIDELSNKIIGAVSVRN